MFSESLEHEVRSDSWVSRCVTIGRVRGEDVVRGCHGERLERIKFL
jgi:hypothetical protein